MQAAVPVLVTEEGRPLTGEEIYDYLQTVRTSQSAATVFPSSDLSSQVSKFCQKLQEVKIGVLTHGLAFHINHTKLLRFPYCKEDFFEKVIATFTAGRCSLNSISLFPVPRFYFEAGGETQ